MIIIKEKCLLIDMSVSTDNNISEKEYNNEIQKLGNINWKKYATLNLLYNSPEHNQEGADKHINKIPGCPQSTWHRKKLLFAEQLIRWELWMGMQQCHPKKQQPTEKV